MGLSNCIRKLGLDEHEAAIVKGMVRDHLDDGYEPHQAANRALNALEQELREERADILAQVHKALGMGPGEARSFRVAQPTAFDAVKRKIAELYHAAFNNPENKQHLFAYRTVDAAEAARLKAQTGVDVEGYERVIDNYSVRHILEQHGNPHTERARGQIEVTQADIERIPEITQAYDHVSSAGKTAQGRDAILYRKQIGDVIYYVEEVRAGKKQLAPVTMWKKAATSNAPAVRSPVPKSPTQTPEAVSRPDDIIGRRGDDIDSAAIAGQRGRTGISTGFNPRPSSLTGDTRSRAAVFICMECFNPRPSSLTGDTLRRPMPMTIASLFQSAPVIADGRYSVRSPRPARSTRFNPRPSSLTGDTARDLALQRADARFNPRPSSLTGDTRLGQCLTDSG